MHNEFTAGMAGLTATYGNEQPPAPGVEGLTAEDLTVTRNACKLCMPLGACLAFKGVAGAMSILHGSQGCSTYIRRYLISHFREPLDVASSNFTEQSTVFGGKSNLHTALDNMMTQYQPPFIGVASTCLSETIGEDLRELLATWLDSRRERHLPEPVIVGVNTPSYAGSHREGFQVAVRETVRQVAPTTPAMKSQLPVVNLLPGMVSTADLRWLKGLAPRFGNEIRLFPDYSESLDGGLWEDYESIPPGGTSHQTIAAMRSSDATLELGALPLLTGSAGTVLKESFGVPLTSLDLPIGVQLTDRFLQALARAGGGTGTTLPADLEAERSRLVDALVDAHKYVAGLPVAIYGEEDFVLALAVFLAEAGLKPVLGASGGKSGLLKTRLNALLRELKLPDSATAADDTDFVRLEGLAKAAGVSLVVGNSKGLKLAAKLDVPLVRLGFPIHDRFGGPRILHLGYGGALEILDRVVNAILERRQARNPVGYTYY